MNDDENEELENEIDPELYDEDFATYGDFDITPDDDEDDEDEEQSEETSEEELAEQIEEQVKGQVQNQAKQAIKEGAKKGAKATGEAAKAAGKAMLTAIKFLFTPPVLYITLAVIGIALVLALILIVVSALGAGASEPYENIDPENGQFATSIGITGDKFYGARAIYYDPTQAQIDLKDYYYAFSEDFLEKVDAMESVNLKITINGENVAPEVIEMSEMIAKTVSGSTEDLTLEEYIALVDHFGYTNIELSAIQIKFIDYLKNNQTNLLTIDEGYTTLETDLVSEFEDFSNAYNVTAPLYYVKDYILEESEEAMLPSLELKNYVALILMTRTDVTINSSSYMFYFPEEQTEGYATTVNFEYVTVTYGEDNVLCTATADSTWWQEGTAETLAEVENINISLQKFNSITETPLENKPLYSLLFDSNNNPSTYNVKKYCTPVEKTDENTHIYYEISYLPYNDGIYTYIRLNGDGVFQFCEFETICDSEQTEVA